MITSSICTTTASSGQVWIIPQVRVGDPAFNAQQTIALMRQAVERKALIVVFPELGLSAYSCEDLFQQQALLDGCIKALSDVVDAFREIPLVAVIGLPLRINHLLFNCAAIVHRGAPAVSPYRALFTISDPLPIQDLRRYSSLQILRTLCVAPEY
jgi:predicted amidohydrolase